MKKISLIAMFCLMAFLFNSIEAQQNKKYHIDLETYNKALAAWENSKEVYGNSYEFTLSFGSFSGYFSKTTIRVVDGKVVKRSFEEGHYYDKKERGFEKWVEEEHEIGTHEKGKAPVTMDQIYQRAKVDTKPRDKQTEPKTTDGINISDMVKSEIYFNVDAEGVISLYGSRPEGCMDDCFNGYRISDFKWLEKNKEEKEVVKGKKKKQK